ncbi:organic solute transporter subunit alpha-like [Erpetoichthys calabaricus]|uniref:organic solute transporter subunit alpha-like n=1 Tax=Erpetoichthys calabaricus TaxID=27687 RepID=UPI002234B15A|nr:organic solute transporter subunit alpha-like [Erpetoichthys calabaricus]
MQSLHNAVLKLYFYEEGQKWSCKLGFSAISSMDRNVSCEGEPPNSEQILRNIDFETSTLYVVLTAMSVIGSLVYLEEVVYILKKIPPSYKRKTYIWVTGAPPVISAASCIALWVPRSSMLTEFTASIYFTICIHKFLVMMVEEYGGDDALLNRLHGAPMRISTGPCCCCCLCLPPVPMSRMTLNILKCGTLQAAFLRPVLLFFAMVLWTNGNYEHGKMKPDAAFLWITILSMAAFILSLWPIAIIFSKAKSCLSRLNIVPKFALNQCILILTQAQGGIISLLVGTGIIACAPPFPARARGAFMNQQLLVMEMFIITILSRCYYRRKYADLNPEDTGPSGDQETQKDIR